MGLEHPFDAEVGGLGLLQVRPDIASLVDNNCASSLLVADQIGRVRQGSPR